MWLGIHLFKITPSLSWICTHVGSDTLQWISVSYFRIFRLCFLLIEFNLMYYHLNFIKSFLSSASLFLTNEKWDAISSMLSSFQTFNEVLYIFPFIFVELARNHASLNRHSVFFKFWVETTTNVLSYFNIPHTF